VEITEREESPFIPIQKVRMIADGAGKQDEGET
jgi:hypothetical protein